jgi:hypothetical protein
MTPKEKAEDLFNKYWLVESDVDSAPYTDKSMSKNCALIAVDEIIKTLKPPCLTEFDYWQQVKQEITNF